MSDTPIYDRLLLERQWREFVVIMRPHVRDFQDAMDRVRAVFAYAAQSMALLESDAQRIQRVEAEKHAELQRIAGVALGSAPLVAFGDVRRVNPLSTQKQYPTSRPAWARR